MTGQRITSSMAMVRVGGKLFPARVSPGCFTCSSQYRAQIERELLAGRSYRAVHDWLVATYDAPEGHPHPSRESLRAHMNDQHLPLSAVVQHRIIEERSREIGTSIEEAAGAVADHVAVNRIIVQRGLERLSAGEIQPEMGDLLTAIRQQQAIDAEHEGGLDAEVWRQALTEYMAIVSRVLTPQQRAQFAQLATASPVLQALQRKQTIEGDVA
jgi:hypothetical protein